MILKFRNAESRERFLEVAGSERPNLLPFLRVRRILPHITASDLDQADADWIYSRIADYGQAFEDIKMDFAGILGSHKVVAQK